MGRHIIKKPSWDDAPEWANWLACDHFGGWCWFEKKPFKHCTAWQTPNRTGSTMSKYKWGIALKLCFYDNWENSLEPKPGT